MPPVHSKFQVSSAKREILINLILMYGRRTGVLRLFLANIDNIIKANSTQIPAAKAKRVDKIVALVSNKGVKRLFHEARLLFKKGTDANTVESKIRSKLCLPSKQLKTGPVRSETQFAVPMLVPAPRNPRKAATPSTGIDDNGTLRNNEVLPSTPYLFPLVHENDEWYSTLYCWVQVAQAALLDSNLGMFHHVTRNAVGEFQELFALLQSSKGVPTDNIVQMLHTLAAKLQDTVALDQIVGKLIKTHSILCYLNLYACGFQEELATKDLNLMEFPFFQQFTNFLVPRMFGKQCPKCNFNERFFIGYEIEDKAFVVNNRKIYPDLTLALKTHYPAELKLRKANFYWNFAIIKELSPDKTVPVSTFLIKAGEKGTLMKVSRERNQIFEQNPGIRGYVVEALFYSAKKPHHLHAIETTETMPIPRPGILYARTVVLRLQLSESPPPALHIQTKDLLVKGRKALKHPNEVVSWYWLGWKKSVVRVCWMNSMLQVVQYAVKNLGDQYFWLLCRNATKDVLAVAESIRAWKGDPSILSNEQRQKAVTSYMEDAKNIKYFFTLGMRTQTLFDVLMRCTDEQCGHEESILKVHQQNFDTPLFHHLIGIESTIDCFYACAGCNEVTKKQAVLIMEEQGFVVEGPKFDGNDKVFPKLQSVAQVYPERVMLDGRSYYRHIMCVVVFFRDTHVAHAFNVTTNHLGGPMRMVCDSDTTVWDVEPKFNEDRVHGYCVTNAFYAHQELGPQ